MFDRFTRRMWALLIAVAVGAVAVACTSMSAASSSGSSSPSANGAASLTVQDLAAAHPEPGSVNPPPLKNGLPPIVTHIDTSDKVVFVTIDDGWFKDQAIIDLIKAWNVPVTPFLTKSAIYRDTDYFKTVQSVTGQHVQDHTLTHPFLTRLTPDGQKKEICRTADTYADWFGTRPWMMRPPYGASNKETFIAANECGMDYVVNWDSSLPMHAVVFADGTSFKPGDIILTHWRDRLFPDLQRMFRRIAREGFKVGALQDYLPPRAR